MRYPDSYKCQTITITKFERNLNSGNTLKYSFINAFPKTISAVPVSYGNSDILKVNVSFNYDRYVVNATSGFSKAEKSTGFVDIPQESAELQQRFDAREQSLVRSGNNNTGGETEVARQTRLEAETQRIVDSNTVPAGSFGITPRSAPEGAFGISEAGRRQAYANRAQLGEI